MLLPQKIKIELPWDPVIPFLGTHPKELKGFQRGAYTPMFKTALFTTAKRWKQSKCPLMDETVNKIWFIHTIKYYLPLRKKEILTSAAIWMNHGNIISKTGQIQKYKYCMIASAFLEE